MRRAIQCFFDVWQRNNHPFTWLTTAEKIWTPPSGKPLQIQPTSSTKTTAGRREAPKSSSASMLHACAGLFGVERFLTTARPSTPGVGKVTLHQPGGSCGIAGGDRIPDGARLIGRPHDGPGFGKVADPGQTCLVAEQGPELQETAVAEGGRDPEMEGSVDPEEAHDVFGSSVTD
jgi:hypothetical protein